MIALGLQARAIALLVLLLLASVVANIIQLRSAWVGYGERRGKANLAQVQGELDSYKTTQRVNEAVAGQKALDTTKLLADLNAIAERGAQTRVIYRAAAARAPLPAVCIPGQGRMDAINAGLSGKASPK